MQKKVFSSLPRKQTALLVAGTTCLLLSGLTTMKFLRSPVEENEEISFSNHTTISSLSAFVEHDERDEKIAFLSDELANAAALLNQYELREQIPQKEDDEQQIRELHNEISVLKERFDQQLASEQAKYQEEIKHLTLQHERLILSLREQAAAFKKLEDERAVLQSALQSNEKELQLALKSRASYQELQEKNTHLSQLLAQETAKKVTLEGEYTEKLQHERQLRLAKEELLEKTTKLLQDQKLAIEKLELARLDSIKELAETRDQYTQIVKELNKDHPALANVRIAELSRKHQVGKGDTLTSISVLYYGTPNRWKEIYDANKHQIPNMNSIRIGAELIIP